MIKVAQLGLGQIGFEVASFLKNQKWAELVGIIDIDTSRKFEEVKIYASFEELCKEAKPDVVIQTTCSNAKIALQQLLPIVERGIDVVSSCEELVYPWLRAPELASQINLLCNKTGSKVVGVGVNPGFVMDALPLYITKICKRVDKIEIERVVNASTRRENLQRKIGSGLSIEEFNPSKYGHAGLKESAFLVASYLNWDTTIFEETIKPLVAMQDIKTDFFEVKAGKVCGIKQKVRIVDKLDYSLIMSLDVSESYDQIVITGNPSLNLKFNGGIKGDEATVAILVNNIPKLRLAKPGLLKVTDLLV